MSESTAIPFSLNAIQLSACSDGRGEQAAGLTLHDVLLDASLPPHILSLHDRVLLCEFDQDGLVTHVNRSLIEVSGFEYEQWLGTHYFHWWHPDMPVAAFASLWDSLQRTTPWHGLIKLACKHGRHFWLDAYIAPLQPDLASAGFRAVHNLPHDEAHVVAHALVSRCADLRRSRQ